MFEFLIALLIFSLGIVGLSSTQLAAKRINQSALQRSLAVALAREMLERIVANSSQLSIYDGAVVSGDSVASNPEGFVDCDQSGCDVSQLARFDVGQWERWLAGLSEGVDGRRVSVLDQARACVALAGSRVSVAISWRSAATATFEALPDELSDELSHELPDELPCIDDAEIGLDDLNRRQRVVMSTVVSGR